MSIVNDFTAIGARLREIERPDSSPDEPMCEACEDGGWEMYSTGHHDPHFRECQKCFNPKGLPSP